MKGGQRSNPKINHIYIDFAGAVSHFAVGPSAGEPA
jgi:hypothetical protein